MTHRSSPRLPCLLPRISSSGGHPESCSVVPRNRRVRARLFVLSGFFLRWVYRKPNKRSHVVRHKQEFVLTEFFLTGVHCIGLCTRTFMDNAKSTYFTLKGANEISQACLAPTLKFRQGDNGARWLLCQSCLVRKWQKCWFSKSVWQRTPLGHGRFLFFKGGHENQNRRCRSPSPPLLPLRKPVVPPLVRKKFNNVVKLWIPVMNFVRSSRRQHFQNLLTPTKFAVPLFLLSF